MELILVYITTSDKAEAKKIGKHLVESRLAACVNIIDGMESMYWWEGKIDSSKEAILIAKTKANLFEKLLEAVKSLHSYSCPCVVSFALKQGNPDYTKWLEENTS